MRDLQRPGRSPIYATHGMASTSHPLATQEAIRILQQGGNALDAAIAAVAVQCVVEPGSTGIGGDCFCLYSPQGSDKVIAFNGSGHAPRGISSALLLSQGLDHVPLHSPHAVTIPGAVEAWSRLHQDHGVLAWEALFEAATTYAIKGYPMGQRVADDFAYALPTLRHDAHTAQVFLPQGKAPTMGTLMQQPSLGETLKRIACEGAKAFYSGDIAHDMVEKLRACGGTHTLEDFATRQGQYVTPIHTAYKGRTLWQCPPNGQGIIALLLMNMLEKIDTFGHDPLNADRVHWEIEAGRLSYRARSLYLADPDQVHVPSQAIIDPIYAEQLRALISPNHALVNLPPCPLPQQQSTVYVSVVDEQRNACSFINTLFHSFGSGIMAPESGVLLHNRGAGFVVQPGHPNDIQPEKRPLHTIIPGMVTQNGRTKLCYGVMGGEYQAFGHMQFLTRMWDYMWDIQAAQDAPRFFPDPYDHTIDLEHAIPDSVCDILRAKGHKIRRASRPIGGSQAIAIEQDGRVLCAGSDPRKDGCALGY